MELLLGVGFLAGIITGISPCIVPVLPVIVAGGATSQDDKGKEKKARPYLIIAGLVTSFTVFTLLGGALLSSLGLPQDFLEKLGVVLLLVIGIGLIIPKVGQLVERPFARLGAKSIYSRGGSFVLGVSLGLVFVPCAGPVLSAISFIGTRHSAGLEAFGLTASYALGAAVPLLILAVLSQRTVRTWSLAKSHIPQIRRISGLLVVAVGIGVLFNLTSSLTSLPGYTSALQSRLEGGSRITKDLHSIDGEKTSTLKSHTATTSQGNSTKTQQVTAKAAGALPDLGSAPTFVGITAWLNTPGGKPETLSGLKGKIVLVDFWTYSCINCQRSLPHVEAWYAKYHKFGLEVVGVHTPEFPFEHVVSNVKAAAKRLGVDYPIAIDNHAATWTAYGNEYWPAEYLIDQNGNIRYTDFGEGDYTTTEQNIRLLLAANAVSANEHSFSLPPSTMVANLTPSQPLTTETYLGSERFDATRYVGSPFKVNGTSNYSLDKSVPENSISLGGTWTQHQWEITAVGKSNTTSVIKLSYEANDVYLVLGGKGTVSVNGTRVVHVFGIPDLYTMIASKDYQSGTLTLRCSKGIQAYDFTFG